MASMVISASGRGAERAQGRAQYVRNVLPGDVGRRAAPEEDRVDLGRAQERAPAAYLRRKRLHVAGHKGLNARVGVEVAVGALGVAEGDVHVQANLPGRAVPFVLLWCGFIPLHSSLLPPPM